MKKIFKTLLSLIIILLCFGGIAAGIYFGINKDSFNSVISNFNSSETNESNIDEFGVVIDGKAYYGSIKGLSGLSKDNPLNVIIKYPSSYSDELKTYSIEIKPSSDINNFYFQVGDNPLNNYSFYELDDYKEGFNIIYEDDSFSIAPVGGIKDILKEIYGDSITIRDKFSEINFGNNIFYLVVYNYNRSKSIAIGFNFIEYDVESVELSEEVISF